MSTSKFTPELAQAIVEALKINPSLSSAATKEGISVSTLSRWIQLGSEGDPTYAQFAIDAAEARSHLKDELVAALRITATDPLHPQQTKAAHQLLTNLYPMEFAKVQHVVQHQEEPNTSEPYDFSVLETEELRTFLRLLNKLEDLNAGKSGVPKLSATVLDVVSKKNGSK